MHLLVRLKLALFSLQFSFWDAGHFNHCTVAFNWMVSLPRGSLSLFHTVCVNVNKNRNGCKLPLSSHFGLFAAPQSSDSKLSRIHHGSNTEAAAGKLLQNSDWRGSPNCITKHDNAVTSGKMMWKPSEGVTSLFPDACWSKLYGTQTNCRDEGPSLKVKGMIKPTGSLKVTVATFDELNA